MRLYLNGEEVHVSNVAIDPALINRDLSVITQSMYGEVNATFKVDVSRATRALRELYRTISTSYAAGYMIVNRRGRNKLVRLP